MNWTEIAARSGEDIGVSKWHLIDQARIDCFAKATDDFQYIHVDPVRAAQTPFGGTIAHGLLVLSLLPAMAEEVLPALSRKVMDINYGYNRIRFLAPVHSGTRVRGRFHLVEMAPRPEPGTTTDVLATYKVTIEIENSIKPALVAQWLILHVLERDEAVSAAQ